MSLEVDKSTTVNEDSMAFRRHWFFRGKAISDEGITVHAIIGGGSVYYREGNRRTHIFAYERDDVVHILFGESPEWKVGPGTQPISPDDRNRVLEHAKQALQVLGYKVSSYSR